MPGCNLRYRWSTLAKRDRQDGRPDNLHYERRDFRSQPRRVEAISATVGVVDALGDKFVKGDSDVVFMIALLCRGEVVILRT